MLLRTNSLGPGVTRCRESGLAGHLVMPFIRSDLATAARLALAARLTPPRPEPARNGTMAPGSPPRAVRPGSLRVLLAEDNPVNQKVAVRLLENLGHRVDVVAGGQDAVAAALTGRFDVVLMDLQMPVLDGAEATRLIRAHERNRASGRLPIVALSAHSAAEEETRCLEAGMDAYLAKPLRPESLRLALARWIEGAAEGDAKAA
jgi:CheY-like chemotaxis protein